MRLKHHLIDEAIVLADKNTKKLYDSTFKKVYTIVMEYMDDNFAKWDEYEDMIQGGAVKLVDEMEKNFDKTKSKTGIIFKPIAIVGLNKREAGAGLPPGMSKQKWAINFSYDPRWTVDVWYSGKFSLWLKGMMETLEHELVHIGQFKAMKKNIRRWQDFEQIIFKGMQKVYAYDEKKREIYIKDMDAYIADRQEVMAYASNAAREMDDKWSAPKILKDVSTTKGQKLLAKTSDVFEMFHEYKETMPKTWKKFVRYFVDYVMQYTRKLEEDIKPTTKNFKFFTDNPGGGWLEDERKKAKKGRWGSLTAGFHDFFQVPIKMVLNLKGMQGERRTLTEPRVQELMASIKEHGMYQPIFINVLYDGTAEINEGNRRTLIAKTLGMKYVPVEVRYYAGGERIEGSWHPDKVSKVAKNWKRPAKPNV